MRTASVTFAMCAILGVALAVHVALPAAGQQTPTAGASGTRVVLLGTGTRFVIGRDLDEY